MWMTDDDRRLLMSMNRKLDIIVARLGLLSKLEQETSMATQATLDRLAKVVADDTNAVSAATTALTHYAQTNADLTAALQKALAGDDEAAVKAAADAMEANNAALLAGVPAVAAAIVTGTPAATPPA